MGRKEPIFYVVLCYSSASQEAFLYGPFASGEDDRRGTFKVVNSSISFLKVLRSHDLFEELAICSCCTGETISKRLFNQSITEASSYKNLNPLGISSLPNQALAVSANSSGACRFQGCLISGWVTARVSGLRSLPISISLTAS